MSQTIAHMYGHTHTPTHKLKHTPIIPQTHHVNNETLIAHAWATPFTRLFSSMSHTCTHTRVGVCAITSTHINALADFHFRWERTREELYYPTINYFSFSHIRWTSSSSLLTFLSNCTFLCCHQLWGRLNEFKESFKRSVLSPVVHFAKLSLHPLTTQRFLQT